MRKNKILVPIKEKAYEVIIEKDILSKIGESLIDLGIRNNRKILIISNEEIANLYGEKIKKSFKNNFQVEIFIIKAGENHKNIYTLNEIYNAAFKFGIL